MNFEEIFNLKICRYAKQNGFLSIGKWDGLIMMRIIWVGLLFALLPTKILACTTAHGVNYAAINASQVLIKGRIRSVRIDQAKGVYVFDVAVQTTLKGEKRAYWTILTDYMRKGEENLDSWLNEGTIYVGFDVIDGRQGIGQFRNDGCGPLDIVQATPSNLDRIRNNVVEPSFW